MVDENDSFIREVNEELRSDQVKDVWRRFGKIIIGLALLIVVGTAGYRGYEYWLNTQASGSGDRFLAALKLSKDGKNDEALAALEALEKDGHGSYPVLAQMRAATIQAQQGHTDAAVSGFDAIAKDTSAPDAIRDVARLRSAWLLIDSGDYDRVSAEVEVMAVPENPMRHSAREALGLTAYKAGEFGRAREWFEQITEDPETPGNVRSRAQMLLDDIIASQGAS
ncbi:tetratricopeptide repeat protein [Agrobacterium sp. ES01]|uniref:tetratricopeptide repeat protein n=1 Tax=Agrobacterium sp. ES01 TaxID=3420714 RepID=UPI003D14E70B